jgi:hypothetical protein
MPALKCHECHLEIAQGANICPHCGTPTARFWVKGSVVAVLAVLSFVGYSYLGFDISQYFESKTVPRKDSKTGPLPQKSKSESGERPSKKPGGKTVRPVESPEAGGIDTEFDSVEITEGGMTSAPTPLPPEVVEQLALSMLESTREEDFETREKIYGTLARIRPDNPEYRIRHESYREKSGSRTLDPSSGGADLESRLAETVRKYGPPPQPGPDGWYPAVLHHVLQNSPHREGVRLTECSGPAPTERGWRVGCAYEFENSVGTVVKEFRWFTLVEGGRVLPP